MRTSVGMMDASTLGKIEIKGADAGEFLNRIYTNAYKKLADRLRALRRDVQARRHDVRRRRDAARWPRTRYYMHTTTGGAAGVLDWLEEWLQTEWPELDVYCTSVTEQWSTVAVVGPKSREVVARMAPDLDVSNEAFGFMTFQETTLASGIPARICRISFSGELAFEINVSRLVRPPGLGGRASPPAPSSASRRTAPRRCTCCVPRRATRSSGRTPTAPSLRRTRAWTGSSRRSRTSSASAPTRVPTTSAPDRKQLVGLLPVDRTTRLPEGSQVIEAGPALSERPKPVPMLGHVTSSYDSVALERPFALALIKGGRDRIGDVLLAPVGDRLVEVEVTSSVLYDPEGTKRDG